MKISFIITVLLLGIQNFLSKKNNYIFGLIIPVFIVIGCVLFLIFKVTDGENGKWIFRFGILIAVNLSIYFEGRDKIKNKKKKELEKMTIKDL